MIPSIKCVACKKDKPTEAYSKRQNRKHVLKRKCIQCVNRPKPSICASAHTLSGVNLHTEYLDLNEQDLEEEIPQEIALNMIHLQHLTLSNSNTKVFPKQFCYCMGLTHIGAYRNQFVSLPIELTSLQNSLTHLWLSGNQFKEFPPVILTLTKLKDLRLDTNQLTVIPPEIGKLQHLEKLLLHTNFLQDLPDEISCLLALKEIEINRNKFKSIPPYVYCQYYGDWKSPGRIKSFLDKRKLFISFIFCIKYSTFEVPSELMCLIMNALLRDLSDQSIYMYRDKY